MSPRPRVRSAARLLVCAVLLGTGAGALGCGGEPETPEGQVRALLEELETAAEAGDVGEVKDHVSERYEDRFGHDHRELAAFLTLQVMRHGDRHLLLRVRDVALRDDGRVTVLTHVGLAGRGGPSPLSADVYEVELDFVDEDGTWRVSWADWKRAPAGALL